jgi:hypothetical protein
MAEILEAIMVISFGISWPISIYKTLKSKTSAGKSLLFISLIIFGYICGIFSKILNIDVKPLNYVFIFYCINLVTTSFDLCLNLYYRNKEAKQK